MCAEQVPQLFCEIVVVKSVCEWLVFIGTISIRLFAQQLGKTELLRLVARSRNNFVLTYRLLATRATAGLHLARKQEEAIIAHRVATGKQSN